MMIAAAFVIKSWKQHHTSLCVVLTQRKCVVTFKILIREWLRWRAAHLQSQDGGQRCEEGRCMSKGKREITLAAYVV
jgi:hypothetical protein